MWRFYNIKNKARREINSVCVSGKDARRTIHQSYMFMHFLEYKSKKSIVGIIAMNLKVQYMGLLCKHVPSSAKQSFNNNFIHKTTIPKQHIFQGCPCLHKVYELTGTSWRPRMLVHQCLSVTGQAFFLILWFIISKTDVNSFQDIPQRWSQIINFNFFSQPEVELL